MAPHGISIPCPFGRPVKQRRKNLSRAAQRLEAMEAADKEWGNKRCDRLQDALRGDSVSYPEPSIPQYQHILDDQDHNPLNGDTPNENIDQPAPAETHH